MMIPEPVLTGGGVTGFIVAVGFVVKQAFDSFNARKSGEVTETSAAVNDASTANAIILKGMKAVSEENAGLRSTLRDRDAELAANHLKIAELTKALSEAQAQIQYIADELQKLKSPQP